MSKFKIALLNIVLMFALSTIGTSANDGLSDLESFFTSNVRITQYTLFPPNDGILFDNETRHLLIENHSYPYPAEIQSISNSTLDENNVLELDVTEPLPDLNGFTHRTQSWVWFFDIEAETFSRLNPLCGEPSSVGWTYIAESGTDNLRLCDNATGNMSEPLPTNLSWEVSPPFSTSPLPVFNSPDGSWLLLFGEENTQTHVFSYNVATAMLTNLGLIPCNFCIEWPSVKWFGTTVTIWRYSDDVNSIYTANVDEADSLESALTRPYYWPEFYDNPPRYDYVNFTTPDNIWETQCERVIYDVLSHQKQIIEMGSLCRPEWGALDGVGYYRDVTQGASGIAELTVFDAETQTKNVLYEGEIEHIEWVSSDEHYAVVVLDSNGVIDTAPFLAPFFWRTPISPILAYIDLVNNEVIFESPTGWNVCDESIGGPNFSWTEGTSTTSLRPCSRIGATGAILPRHDNTFLVIGDTEPDNIYGNSQFADLVTVSETGVIRTRLQEGRLFPFTSEYVLSRRTNETNQISFNLVSVTGELLEITNPIHTPESQNIQATDIYPSSNEIRFSISRERSSESDWYTANVTVQVQIPD